MSWFFKIIDGLGTGKQARVSKDHALYVTSVNGDLPAVGSPSRLRYFQQKLHRTTDENDFDMNVNASVTPITFELNSAATYDIHIQNIVILISDSAITMNRFGNIAGITAGLTLTVSELGAETNLITNAITNGEILAQSGGLTMTGSSTGIAPNEIENWSGQSDAFLVAMPVGQYVTDGIRIGRQTPDRIFCTLTEDFSGLDEFSITMIGQRVYEASLTTT